LTLGKSKKIMVLLKIRFKTSSKPILRALRSSPIPLRGKVQSKVSPNCGHESK